MLHINVICIGKLKEKYLQDALSEYSKRLSKYCILNITELPDEKLPNNLNDSLTNMIKEKESNNIISHIEKNSYVITLDLNGKQYTSEEFSRKINNISLNNSSSITFIIGGTLGLSDKVLKLIIINTIAILLTFLALSIFTFLIKFFSSSFISLISFANFIPNLRS